MTVKKLAGCKGLEPSTFCVTGRRSKPAELTPRKAHISYTGKYAIASIFFINVFSLLTLVAFVLYCSMHNNPKGML